MNILTSLSGDYWADIYELLDAEFTLKKLLWSTSGEVLVDKTLKITRYIDHIRVENKSKGLVRDVRLHEEHQDGDPYV